MLKAAIIGFGGIAQAHKNGYFRLEKDGLVKLAAVCDIRSEAFTEQVKINLDTETADPLKDVHFYTDLEEMLAKETLDFADICVPSYLHKEIAVKMLKKGYNVLCEKPMALNSRDCAEMLEAEKQSGKKFMIAQCLRFFPEYRYLKTCMEENRYGKVLNAFFNRNSAQPSWGFEQWYMDYDRCGGAVTDIHIHDVDMVRFLFGEPDAVSCRASDGKTRYDICQTAFYYKNGIPVSANGCWTPAPIAFAPSYKVDFEHASVIYENGKVTVYPEGGMAFAAEMSGYDGYTAEIAYFARVVKGETENSVNPASSAAKTIALIEKMKESADARGAILKF